MATEDRIRQVETTRQNWGKNHYKEIGSRGGKNSPAKFTSESGKKASQARWASYREKLKAKEPDGKTKT